MYGFSRRSLARRVVRGLAGPQKMSRRVRVVEDIAGRTAQRRGLGDKI